MATSPTTSGIGFSMGGGVSSESMTVGRSLSNDQGQDETNHLPGSAPPESRIAYRSTHRLPCEIVEMIVAYLTHDLDVLKACSLACRSWYIAAVPHIHHTLTLGDDGHDESRQGLKPLSVLHGFGLASLIKRIQVKQGSVLNEPWFVPWAFGPDDLRHFSAFANVRTLVFHILEISEFIPGAEQYFGHLSSTIRSIVLVLPRCTPRQLSHFLSLFSNLDNIDIAFHEQLPNTTTPDTDLVPFSTPKLQGRLELRNFDWVETWTDLIASCGGLRFRYMDLHCVEGCAPVLLGACAETLETLRCSVLGVPSPSLLPEFDLSQLKVLQSLQVGDWAGKTYIKSRHNVVMEVFLTITSPVFSELVIVLTDYEIPRLPSDVTLFKALRTMKEVRSFKLVFLFDPLSQDHEGGRRRLVEVLDLVNARGSLDFLDFPPTVC